MEIWLEICLYIIKTFLSSFKLFLQKNWSRLLLFFFLHYPLITTELPLQRKSSTIWNRQICLKSISIAVCFMFTYQLLNIFFLNAAPRFCRCWFTFQCSVKDIYVKTPSELSLVSCDSAAVSQELCVLSFIISLPLTVADVAILCFMKQLFATFRA